MRKGGHRFRQAEESGSTEERERAQRRASFSGLGRTLGSAEAGNRRLLKVTGGDPTPKEENESLTPTPSRSESSERSTHRFDRAGSEERTAGKPES